MTEINKSERQRAPWHLWVIGVIALLWNMMGPFDYLMTQTKNEAYMGKFTPEQLEFYYSLPTWVISSWAIAVWFGLLGSILLLLRRGLASWVFAISFVAMVMTTIHNYLFCNAMEAMGGAGSLVFSAVIFVVALGLMIYSFKLKKSGILR